METRDKAWFQANVTIDETKIKLEHWDDEYVVPTDITGNTFFKCTNQRDNKSLEFSYEMAWLLCLLLT